MADKKQKPDLFEFIVESYAWCEVVFAALVAGLIVGAVIYAAWPGTQGRNAAIASVCLSIIIGLYLANKNRKEKKENEPDADQERNKGFF